MTFSPNLISDCGNERKNTETEEYDLLKHLLFKTSFDCHDTSRVTRPFWRRNFPPGAVKENPRLYLLGSLASSHLLQDVNQAPDGLGNTESKADHY